MAKAKSKHPSLTAKRVVDLARKYLAPHQPREGYRLVVREKGVKKDDGWWYVLVEPDREDIHSYDYYGRLAEAEIDLEDKEHVNVLLVPVLPA
jgi:hypothetical protein